MKKEQFKKGETVYIQGFYRAVVVDVFPSGDLSLDVYEGLSSHDKAPWRGTYWPGLVKHEKYEKAKGTPTG